MAIKTYKLTVVYDEAEDDIKFLSEEIERDKRYFEVGTLYLEDYFDDETLDMMHKMYDIGEAWEII